MYNIKLFETAYIYNEGQYTKAETDHLFKVEGVKDLMELVGSMAAASDDEIKLSIKWEDE